MELWKAAVLGIVQGLTEFLPVSSSGHIILFEKLLRVGPSGGMFFGVMLHAGTLIAVLFAYFSKIKEICKTERKMLLYLALATVPAAAVGFFFGDAVDGLFFGGEYLWLFFALTALLLLVSERVSAKLRLLRPAGIKTSLIAGAAQAFAVIPGLSRSGTTLSACLFAGMEREKAADFSFLMSIPIIAGAIFSELLKVFSGNSPIAEISWQSLAAGTLFAAVSGFFSIKLVMKSVRSGKLYGFAVYLLILSAFLLAARVWHIV